MLKGLKTKFLFILQLCFTIKECKIDLSNDMSFNLSDQYACAPFKHVICTIVNRQMEMLVCFCFDCGLTSR